MSSEASRLAVSIGGVEERVSAEAKVVQQQRTNLEKHKRRLQAGKVQGCCGMQGGDGVEWGGMGWDGMG